MLVYFDTSALLKVYVDEPEHAKMAELLASADTVATSKVTYVEICSAFSRLLQEKRLSQVTLEPAKSQFEADWSEMTKVETTEQVIRQAGALAFEYQLRALDSIHLASMEAFRTSVGENIVVACFDNRLRKALKALGFLFA